MLYGITGVEIADAQMNASGSVTLENASNQNLVDYKIYGNSKNNENIEIVNLPEGYQQIEYIQSTGSQIVDTGIKANLETKIVFDYQYYELSEATGSGHLFGCRTNENSSAFICSSSSGKIQTTTNLFTQFDNTTPTNVKTVRVDTNRHTIELSKNGAYYDGELWRTFDNATEFITRENLLLFGMWNISDTTIPSVGGIYRLYSCKLYEGNELKRNFVPCKNSANVIGLYDIVTNTLYTSVVGTETFNAGPNVSIEAESVGDKVTDQTDINYGMYKIPVKVRGKNLFDKTDYTTKNNQIGFSTKNLVNGKKYTVTSNVPIEWFKISSNPSGYNSVQFFNAENGFTKYTFTMSRHSSIPAADEQFLFIAFDNQNIPTTIDGYNGVNIQIEEGETETAYKPYGEAIINIYLKEPLRKVGEYVDCLDFKDRMVVRNVEEVNGTLKGLEEPKIEMLELPNIRLFEHAIKIEVDTEIKPSDIKVTYYQK